MDPVQDVGLEEVGVVRPYHQHQPWERERGHRKIFIKLHVHVCTCNLCSFLSISLSLSLSLTLVVVVVLGTVYFVSLVVVHIFHHLPH